MSEWQPIETAPKSRDVLIDLWIVAPKSPWNIRAYSARKTDCYWGGGEFAWLDRSGKAVTGRRYYDYEGDDCFAPLDTGTGAIVATHWMYPPAPPSIHGETAVKEEK